MSNFIDLLREFDETLRSYNMQNYEKLVPPLDTTIIKDRLNTLGIYNQDFESLYSWKNGSDDRINQAQIFSLNCCMFPLETLMERQVNNYVMDNMNDGLMLLFGNQEEFLLLNQNEGNNYGKLHLFSVPLLSIENPNPYFDSLESMLRTTITLYQEGAMFYDEVNDFLDEDTELGIAIYNRFNPECDFYRNA